MIRGFRELTLDEYGNDMEHYNCGGFALKTYDWYVPENKEDGYIDTTYLVKRLGLGGALQYYINCLLCDFPNLKLIEKEEQLKSYETLVLFRLGESDFHFARKEKDGKYYHKRGWNTEIEEMSKEEVYGYSWCRGKYISKVVMFAYDESISTRKVV
jgi:hypothetical protein